MLTGIKINNLRNLNFENYIKINPLTILLGKNSSGKSSFLRFFSLIRQSLETKRSVPLLWYGNLVDFGSFEETLKRNSKDNKMEFSFEVKELGLEIYIELSLKKENEVEYLNFIKLYTKEDKVEIEINSKNETISLNINDRKIFENFKCYYLYPNSLLPDKIIKINSNREDHTLKLKEIYEKMKIVFKILKIAEGNDLSISILNVEQQEERMLDSIREFINFYLREGRAFIRTDERLFSDLKAFLTRGGKFSSFKSENYERLNIHFDEKIDFEEVKNETKELKNLLILNTLENIFLKINNIIFENFHNVSYIAPLRATAERYYRFQGLDINEMSPNGSNLPMYFKSLNYNELKSFNKWIKENFGFEINLTTNGGHISLGINQNNEIINLTDTGFGFSQILPIIVQLWNKTDREEREKIGTHIFRNRSKNNQIFSIEQPELHLHPAMQAQLIDAIIKSIKLAKKNGINIKFIIETHSETIINRIGRHIVEELFEPQNINLLIFEKQDKKTNIIEAKFNNRGRLEKWPFGFFEPGDINYDY